MITLIQPEAMASQRSRMGYEDYLAMAGESKIMEWIDGEGLTYMPSLDIHQDMSGFLSTLLNLFIQFFDLGVLRYAPYEVKLGPNGPSREPDILFVARANKARLTDQRFEGPDLIIKIISPSSVTED